jgi:hypothetical protein
MPWFPSDLYSDFLAPINGIENPLALEVRVDPTINNGANLLCIYTGTAMLGKLWFRDENHVQSADYWSRGQVKFLVPTPGRTWSFIPPPGYSADDRRLTYFHGGTVVLSLASIFNKNVANNAGWAVDGADVYGLGYELSGLEILAAIAVRDSDGFLYRLSYQVTVLGKGPIPRTLPPFRPDTPVADSK